MLRLSVKKRILLSILIVASLLFLIIGLIIIPTIQYIKQLKNSIEITQTELENRYQKTKLLRKSIQELEQVKQTAEKFTEAIKIPQQEIEIITTLEAIAEKNHIEQNLNVSLSADADKKYYTMSFLDNGSFLDHISYLRDLEKLPYYIIIDHTKWEKKGTLDNNLINLRFDGLIYVDF